MINETKGKSDTMTKVSSVRKEEQNTEEDTKASPHQNEEANLAADELVALQQAILAVEEKEDSGPLSRWAREQGNAPLVVRDSLNGGTNHGTPLYIATVLDASKAVKLLLSLGADPNWKHPDHGDTCLLHASERGHVECLNALLECSQQLKGGAVHQTVDRKIFLGQGMPQYQEGGLNPIHVAAVNGRLEAIQSLLAYDEKRQGHLWLNESDSFGRDIVQMVVETIAMKKEKSPMRLSLHSILRLITDRLGIDATTVTIPDVSVASKAERERQKSLRARWLEAQMREKHEKRMQGLLAIERSYVPLHPDMYCSILPKDALVVQEPAHIGGSVKEPLPGVFTFQLLRKDYCSRLWDEFHHYERVAISEPEKELPLYVRHDGNLGNLQDCGFANILEALQTLLQPIVEQYMPNIGGQFKVYHGFLTRNSPELEKNTLFKLHRDKSDLTFNVCLHKSDDVIGSTVGFYTAADGDRNGSCPSATESACSNAEYELRRAFTYEHEVGSGVFHNGSHMHKTDPIERGTRGSLIIWARLLNDESDEREYANS